MPSAAPEAFLGAMSTAISPPRKHSSTPMLSPNSTMASASSQKCTPGTSRNRHKASTFSSPNSRAGRLRLPPKKRSEITPENTVPTMPQAELMEMMKLASSVS